MDYFSWIKGRIEERITQFSDPRINLFAVLWYAPPFWFLLVFWFCAKRCFCTNSNTASGGKQRKTKQKKKTTTKKQIFWGDSKVAFMLQLTLQVTESVLRGSINSSSQQNIDTKSLRFPCGAKKMFCSATWHQTNHVNTGYRANRVTADHNHAIALRWLGSYSQ